MVSRYASTDVSPPHSALTIGSLLIGGRAAWPCCVTDAIFEMLRNVLVYVGKE